MVTNHDTIFNYISLNHSATLNEEDKMHTQMQKNTKTVLLRSVWGYGLYFLILNIICIMILSFPQYIWLEYSKKEIQQITQYIQIVMAIFYIYIIINGVIILKTISSLYSSNMGKLSMQAYVTFIGFVVFLYLINHITQPIIALSALHYLFHVNFAYEIIELLEGVPIISTLKILICFSSYFVCLPFSWVRFMQSKKTINDIKLLVISIFLSEFISVVSSSLIVSSARNAEMFLHLCPYTLFDVFKISSADTFFTCTLSLFDIGYYPTYLFFVFVMFLCIYQLVYTFYFLSIRFRKKNILHENTRFFYLRISFKFLLLCIFFLYCINCLFFYSISDVNTSDIINKSNKIFVFEAIPDLSANSDYETFSREYPNIMFETEKVQQQYLESISSLLKVFQHTLEISYNNRNDRPSSTLLSHLGNSLDRPLFYPVNNYYIVKAKNDYVIFLLNYILGKKSDTKLQFIKLQDTISEIIKEGDVVSLRCYLVIFLKEIKLLSEYKWLDTSSTYAAEQLLFRVQKVIYHIYSKHCSMEKQARILFSSLFSEGNISMMPFNHRKSIIPMTNCKLFFPLIYIAFKINHEEWMHLPNMYLLNEISYIHNILKLTTGIIQYNSITNLLSVKEINNLPFIDIKIGIFNRRVTCRVWSESFFANFENGTANSANQELIYINKDILFIWIPGHCIHEKDRFDTSPLECDCHISINTSPFAANINKAKTHP